jgi:LysM repeat protein
MNNSPSRNLGWLGLTIAVGLLMVWSIQNLIPAPQPADDGAPTQDSMLLTPTIEVTEDNAATPIPDGKSFDYRGAKLILNAPLPDSPGQANVYNLLDSQPPTEEYARSLANQFGIEGEVYVTNGKNTDPSDTSAFMVTDGKQQLVVYSENDFTYTSDMVENSHNYNGVSVENAEPSIREYLSNHGFDFDYSFEESELFGGHGLKQLSPDGLPIEDARYPHAMHITFNENGGDILSLNATMLNYDSAPLGTFGIISAKEALQHVLDDTLPAGKIESASSSPAANFTPPQTWHYEYPDNQVVTLYGNVAVNRAIDQTKPAVIFINYVPVIGSTDGMDTLEPYAFVQATGRFIVENGVRKFNVEMWDEDVEQAYVSGFAHRKGEQIIFTTGGESSSEYTLVDPPADLPLDTPFPESELYGIGAVLDGQFYWTSIQFFADSSKMGGGGGGGGGGISFYQLNLSGTPIPIPTPTQPTYSAAELAGFLRYTVQAGDTLQQIAAKYNVSVEDILHANYIQEESLCIGCSLVIPGVPGPIHLDGERGIVQVMIYEKPDGRQRTQYMFTPEKDPASYELKGSDLEALQNLANRPLTIWGDISIDETGMYFLNVEKYEALYPDLQFQVLTGTQEIKEIEGQQIVFFNTGGTNYVQLVPSGGGYPSNYMVPPEYMGEVNIEALQVPGETYAGYPALRVFNVGLAVDPNTGEPIELYRLTDHIEVLPDPYGNADQYIQPNVTIEKIELCISSATPHIRKTVPKHRSATSNQPGTSTGMTITAASWIFSFRPSNLNIFRPKPPAQRHGLPLKHRCHRQ